MYKIVTLSGKAGAGKDRMMQEVLKVLREESPEFTINEIVSCTTRPMREGEVNGRNYYFLTHEEFAERLADGTMVEATIFNDWCYGSCLEHMNEDGINIGVYNPEGVAILQSIPDIMVYSIFVDAPDKVRLLRQLNREENPDVKEIIRRFSADEADFSPDNLIDINFQYTVDNGGKYGLYQLSHELAGVIQRIDWRKHR
jgi:guanylate kinase